MTELKYFLTGIRLFKIKKIPTDFGGWIGKYVLLCPEEIFDSDSFFNKFNFYSNYDPGAENFLYHLFDETKGAVRIMGNKHDIALLTEFAIFLGKTQMSINKKKINFRLSKEELFKKRKPRAILPPNKVFKNKKKYNRKKKVDEERE